MQFLFNSGGSALTRPHNFESFTFTSYSPVAFSFLREAFGITALDYTVSKTSKNNYYTILYLIFSVEIV